MDKKLFIFHVYVDCVAVVYRNSMRYAMNELKDEISGISVKIAENVVGREISEEDHKELIDSFIDEL